MATLGADLPIAEEAVVEVRVGTWNPENLFLPGEQFGPPPDVFEQKLTGLADTISRLNPDLLGLKEVVARGHGGLLASEFSVIPIDHPRATAAGCSAAASPRRLRLSAEVLLRRPC